MEAVLPIEYVDYDRSVEETGDISQMSAEEYLSWVRHQASQLPAVVRAEINSSSIPMRQSKYMPVVEEILQCPVEYLPSEDWEIDTLHSFSELRQTLGRLSAQESSRERQVAVPQMKDREAWRLFCLGRASSDMTANSADIGIDNDGVTTVPVTIASELDPAMDEVTVSKRKRQLEVQFGLTPSSSTPPSLTIQGGIELGGNVEEGEEEVNCDDEEEEHCFPDVDPSLRCFTGGQLPPWTGAVGVVPSTSVLLQFDQVLTQRVFGYHVDWLEEQEEKTTLSAAAGQWIYGLLARLEKPVCQTTVAVIRQLYRRCCNLRHHLCSESESFDADLAALNVLISITGSYFGQGEAYVSFNHTNHATVSGGECGEEEEDDEDEAYLRAMEGDWGESGDGSGLGADSNDEQCMTTEDSGEAVSTKKQRVEGVGEDMSSSSTDRQPPHEMEIASEEVTGAARNGGGSDEVEEGECV